MTKKKAKPDERAFSRLAAFVNARFLKVGFNGLTDAQRLAYCVQAVWWSTFANYFMDDGLGEDEPGDDFPTPDDIAAMNEVERMRGLALAGLREIGARKAATAFNNAWQKANWDRNEIRFRNAEDVEALLVAYALDHPRDFPLLAM